MSDVTHKEQLNAKCVWETLTGCHCALRFGLSSPSVAVGFSTGVQRVGVPGAVSLPTSQPDAWRETESSCGQFLHRHGSLSFVHPSPHNPCCPHGTKPRTASKARIRQHKKQKNPCMEGTPVSYLTPRGLGRPVPRDQLVARTTAGLAQKCPPVHHNQCLSFSSSQQEGWETAPFVAVPWSTFHSHPA